MTTYTALIATLTLALLVVHFVRKERDRHASRVHREQQRAAVAQVWEVLTLIKEYQESARISRKEATIAKSESVSAAAAVTERVEQKAQEIVTKIDAVPDRVAAALKGESDSGHTLPVVRPRGEVQ